MTEQNTTGAKPGSDEFPSPSRSTGSPDAALPASDSDCRYAPRVSAYHDGEVSEIEAGELARHLAGCQACTAQLAFFGRVSSTFEAAAAPRLGPDVRQRLAELGKEFPTEPLDRLRIKPSADVRWVRRLTAAAAILFVVAAGKVIYEQKIASHGSGTVTPAFDPHERVAPHPQPADFVVGRSVPSAGSTDSKPPTTAETQKP